MIKMIHLIKKTMFEYWLYFLSWIHSFLKEKVFNFRKRQNKTWKIQMQKELKIHTRAKMIEKRFFIIKQYQQICSYKFDFFFANLCFIRCSVISKFWLHMYIRRKATSCMNAIKYCENIRRHGKYKIKI